MHDADPSFLIKVCGITSLQDGLDALSSGANALGFNFYPQSPRYLTPEQASAIVNGLRSPYLRVGVFVNATEEELLRVGDQVHLDVLQLHGESCAIPIASGFRIWLSLAAETSTAVLDPRVETYLLDTPTKEFGGSGRVFDWKQAAGFPGRMVVAGGLHAGNVGAAIEMLRPWGVDACSRLESSPGKKDRERVRAYVEAAEQARRRQRIVVPEAVVSL